MSKKNIILYIALFMFAIVIRIAPLNVLAPDYVDFLSNWYKQIIFSGKINSLGIQIGNYTPPYIYLLTIGTYFTENSLYWIKFVSILFDFAMAYGVYLISRHFKVKNPLIPALITLLIPGVFINSAFVGQCDSIYTSFVIFCLYYLLKGKNKLAFFVFGIALSFKIQAIFVAPAFIYLLITKKIKWYDLAFIVMGFVFMMFPAIAYGKGIDKIINIYLGQTEAYQQITKSAPNIYSLLGLNYINVKPITKMIVSLYTIIISIVISIGSKAIRDKQYNETTFFKRALLLSLIVPFILPSMMDRYFYLANVLLLIAYFVFESPSQLYNGQKFLEKQKMVQVLAALAYSLPVLTINFYSLKNMATFFIGEYIIVTLICSVINTYILYHVAKRYYFNIKN